MTFAPYFSAIIEVAGISRYDLVLGFFMAAGYTPNPNKEFISESTVNSWFKIGRGYRECRYKNYFKNLIIDTEGLYDYLRETINENWRILQERFRTEDYGKIDINTTSQKVFLHSLINEFQSFGKLRYTYFEEEKTPIEKVDVLPQQSTADEDSHDELSLEKLRDEFINSLDSHDIMGIIKRKPPILKRDDARKMIKFVKKFDYITYKQDFMGIDLYNSISLFVHILYVQYLILDANLNANCGADDSDASFNMAKNDSKKMNLKDQILTWRIEKRFKKMGIMKLTPKLIKNSADPLRLAELDISNWHDIRDLLIDLHEDIKKWKNDSQT